MEEENIIKDSNNVSFYTLEDELFDYILNLEYSNIKDMFGKKKLPIWEYKSKDNYNSSALNLSVYKKSLKITELLINYCKAEYPEKLSDFVNAPNDQGISPLHYASFNGDVPLIKLLIENGADITKTTKRKLNVIHYCAQGNKPNSLMYFYLKMKEDINKENKYELIKDKDGGGSTALHWAVYSLAEDLLLYLINLCIFTSEEEKYNFINQLDNEGYSALHLSISSKSSRIAMKLLQNGADPLVVNKKGETPLQLAINKNQKDIIQILKNSLSNQLCNIKAPAKRIKKSKKNIICVFIFQLFSFLMMFVSILPIFLTNYNNIFCIVFICIYIFTLFIFFLLYLILLIRDPGLKKKKHLDDLKDLINKNSDLTKYCYKCFIKKTKTSKHCIICDNCYEKFDHHCYWINQCVAEKNYSLFIIFLVETAFYLTIILIISVLSLIKIETLREYDSNSNKFDRKYMYFKKEIYEYIFKNKFIIHLIINIILILIILSFLIPELLLVILHIKVCLTNFRVEKKKQTSTPSTSTSLLNDDSSLFSNSIISSKG